MLAIHFGHIPDEHDFKNIADEVQLQFIRDVIKAAEANGIKVSYRVHKWKNKENYEISSLDNRAQKETRTID